MIDPNDIQRAPTDQDRMRHQARQRFIGAAVLLIIAVVAFPFLLDSQARLVSPNVVIDMPKADTAAAPTVVAPAPASPPAVVASASASASAPEPEKVLAPPVFAASMPTASVSAAASSPIANADGARAEALLNGHASAPSPTASYVIQAGSYSDAGKLHDVQAKLDKAGLKHYTQTAHSKDGTPYTRVRLGPFETQKEANAIAARIAKLGIKTIVLKP